MTLSEAALQELAVLRKRAERLAKLHDRVAIRACAIVDVMLGTPEGRHEALGLVPQGRAAKILAKMVEDSEIKESLQRIVLRPPTIPVLSPPPSPSLPNTSREPELGIEVQGLYAPTGLWTTVRPPNAHGFSIELWTLDRFAEGKPLGEGIPKPRQRTLDQAKHALEIGVQRRGTYHRYRARWGIVRVRPVRTGSWRRGSKRKDCWFVVAVWDGAKWHEGEEAVRKALAPPAEE